VVLGEKGLKGGENENLGKKIFILYSSVKFVQGNDYRVEKMYVTLKRGREYGIMLYLDYGNGKWLRK
jgi:hypothetical protein